jgi:hypothetical protein
MDPCNCPVTLTTHIIGGKWKPSVLFYLEGRVRRFSELQRLLAGPTKKMLTQQLRELERDDIVRRKVYAEVARNIARGTRWVEITAHRNDRQAHAFAIAALTEIFDGLRFAGRDSKNFARTPGARGAAERPGDARESSGEECPKTRELDVSDWHPNAATER